MTPDSVIYEGEGLNLRDLARVRSGTHSKQIQTTEALGSQLAYIAETRREHGYSRAVDRLFDLVLDYVSHAEDAWRAGRSVIWTSAPLMPVYYAHDILPIPISELGRLGSADAIGIAEDAFQIPKESCSMVGAILGEFYLRTGRTPPRLVVYNGQCEPLNLAWELLKDEGFDVFRVEAVSRSNVADDPERVAQLQAYLVDEVRRTVLWLTGKPVDENRLAAQLRRSNRIIGKMRRVLRLRLKNPLYIRSLATMYLLAGMNTHYGKPDQYEEVLDLLVEELEAAAAAPEPHDKLVRLAWVGGRGRAVRFSQGRRLLGAE